jgi:hypothetical protein
LKLRHLAHGANLVVQHRSVTREYQPWEYDVVADLQPISSHSASFEDHVAEALGALLHYYGPAIGNPPFPLAKHCVTHILTFSFGHRSCISFEIQVRLAGAVFANDFVETAILGYFQKIGDKLYSATEGTVPLPYPPFLPVLPGPVICCNVEGTRGEVVSYLEHGLLGLQSLHSDFPEWEGVLPHRGAWGVGSSRKGVEVHSSWCPWSGSQRYRLEND